MRRVLVRLSRTVFQTIYRRHERKRRENLVVFLSRQTDRPSYDYVQLAREFESRGWTCIMHLKKVRARNILAYSAHVVRELHLLGACKVAVLDRYDPAVSLLDFECDPLPNGARDGADSASGAATESAIPCAEARRPRNLDFPRKPTVLQIWHAFGAYKKFGFQSVGTMEGHSVRFTEAYNIHRNYSWVLCSCEAARPAFSEAFSCPIERVVALERPEYDELVEAGLERRKRVRSTSDDPFNVLMAPTLRKDRKSEHPFRSLFEDREMFEEASGAKVTWSFHPLETRDAAPGNVSELLLEADCVVTDYSSIVYEAALLGIPAVFYVPDLDAYRVSPGLNADPGKLCPELCMNTPQELAAFLQLLAAEPESYPCEALARFAATGFDGNADGLPGTAASRIVDFTLEQVALRDSGPDAVRERS